MRATFGAGCFWGIEHFFRQIKGVKNVVVGYGGGMKSNPTYKEVCTGATGHAELVDIEFDEKEVSYKQLCESFWKCHDPTQLNRQGYDVGTQYRSVIYTHSHEQQETAQISKAEEQKKRTKNIATVIESFISFFPAEEYHQRYIEKKRKIF